MSDADDHRLHDEPAPPPPELAEVTELREITETLIALDVGIRLALALNALALLGAIGHGPVQLVLVVVPAVVSLLFLRRMHGLRLPASADVGLLVSVLCLRRMLARNALIAAVTAFVVSLIGSRL